MSQAKIKNQNLNEIRKINSQESLRLDIRDIQDEMTETERLKKVLQEDPNTFLLNNILMSIQFFENYDRDIKLLRENWFKEVPLDLHHKKCFHADSLFRLSESKVKFSPRNGINKISETPLHPFRIYISSDNVEAAYDPSALGRNVLNVHPQYHFTVKTDEKSEKSGCISLVQFKKRQTSRKSVRVSQNHVSLNHTVGSSETEEPSSNYSQRMSCIEEKCSRRLTKTHKSVGFRSKVLNLKTTDKRNSLCFATTTEGIVSVNGFYKFKNSQTRLKPVSINSYRMNVYTLTSHEIPSQCFQREEVKNKTNSKRNRLKENFTSRNVLNSAAFISYFCDLLIERFSESLNLDFDALNESSVLEEFVVVNQKGVQYCIAPVITIRDWNYFVQIGKKFQTSKKTVKLEWPSYHMQKILNILPCNAVPFESTNMLEENVNSEKTWKLIFPKAEEFLLLHMMHAHIRCYFFVLLIYKSFIESEINVASFGPNHLRHLLFWRVHKNFLAWPEDRPGETLLNYLKALYKKLQKKSLCDFFINSRNLFAGSLPKDLHKAQVIIKKIIENPVPYIIRAVVNLNFESNFYPVFDIIKLYGVLVVANENKESKKNKKEKKLKTVPFQNDEKQHRKVNMTESTEWEQEEICKLSIESTNIEKILNFNSQDSDKYNKVLNMFTSHFIEMASKSVEFMNYTQALFYMHQSEKLYELMIFKGVSRNNFKDATEKINKLKEICHKKLKQNIKKSFPKEQYHLSLEKSKENSKIVQINTIEKPEAEKVLTEQDVNEKYNCDEKCSDENEIISIKL